MLLYSPANDNSGSPKFEEKLRLKLADDVRDERDYQPLQFPVADVPRRDQQQFRWTIPEDVPVYEVSVLGDHHPLFPVGQVIDLVIRRGS